MTPADLKAWRLNNGLSQRRAADYFGVTLATFQSWERGASWKDGKPLAVKPMVIIAAQSYKKGVTK